MTTAPLVGPDLARLSDGLRPVRGRLPVLLVRGPRGSGKSTMLAAAVERAGRHRILPVRAPATVDVLIGQLLLQVRQVRAPGADDAVALRNTLRAMRPRTPPLIVVDDAHRLAPEAAALLADLAGAVAGVLVAAPAGQVPAALAGFPALDLRPLSRADAERLVGTREPRPTGGRRAAIVHRAAGNPAALLELDGGRPVDGGLRAAFAAEIRQVGTDCGRLLACLAVAGAPTAAGVIADAAGVTPADWEPVERAGLVARTGDVVSFTHPLVAEVADDGALAHQRREMGQALSRDPRIGPERRARHLAARTTGRIEDVAAGLEAAAEFHRERAELFDAASLFAEAAERTPEPEAAARRLTLAAGCAGELGWRDWTADLAAAVRRTARDPGTLRRAAGIAATALSDAGCQHEAFSTLTAGDEGADRETLRLATAIAVASADDGHRRALKPLLERAGAGPDEPIAVLAGLLGDPAAHRGRAFSDTVALPAPGAAMTEELRHQLLITGTIAWHEDRSRLAAGLLAAALSPSARPALISVLVDIGQWSLADQHAEAPDPAGSPLGAATVAALRAQLLAIRGQGQRAQELTERAWHRVDAAENRLTHAHLARAAGLAASSAGHHEQAYRSFRALFDRAGRPRHPLLAPRSIADLAAAAARIDRRADAAGVFHQVKAGADPSPRMRLLLHLAAALLRVDDRVEQHFRLAVIDPAGDEWPYERALARLHYGEWLRRARRPRDARAVLAAAADTFTALGAAPAGELARGELRASGRYDGTAGGSRLMVLTAQEQHVARLAAAGLGNREIAERLFISARTVSTHLHSTYRKLGVSGRNQLDEALPP